MAEVERNGDDVTIKMKVSELEDLTNILEKTGNSTCRERTKYPADSLPHKFRLQLAQAAWDWSENLSIHRPNIPHTFTVTIKEL